MNTSPNPLPQSTHPEPGWTLSFRGSASAFAPLLLAPARPSSVLRAVGLWLLALLPCLPATAATLLVWPDSPAPTAPYTNWATAARTIQAAVDAAQAGDTVLVTNGVYATGGRAVYGTTVNRVAVDRPVVVRSVNGPAVSLIQGIPAPNPNHEGGPIRCAYLTNGAVLSGFTLTNGSLPSGDTREGGGGGVWCESTNALVTNCTITGNSAWFGGGAYSGTLDHSALTRNTSTRDGGGAHSSSLLSCTLVRNYADMVSSGVGGGAYACTLSHCDLIQNGATDGGGAFDSVLDNCVITGNQSMDGGGGAAGGTLNNCSISGNDSRDGGGASTATLNNCTLSSNSATWGGAAYYATLNNCTLIGNSAPWGGGACYGTLNNSILYYNFSEIGYPNYCYSSLNYCCTTPAPGEGTGHLTAEPLFVDLTNGNLRLRPSSPCIDAGLNAYARGETDLDGRARILDGRVDIGAYEFPSLGQALNAPQLTWTTSSNAPWVQEATVPHDGLESARSAVIANNQQSWLETTLTGPGGVSFWWKVSSEPDFDLLHFVLDGQTNASLSGEVGWTHFTLALAAGTHTLRWVYAKDEALAEGLDQAWLDEVVFTPASTLPVIVTPPGDLASPTGQCVSFSFLAAGLPPLSYQWLFNGTLLPGETNTSLTLCPVLAHHGGAYAVAVGNDQGWVTSATPALLTVLLPPSITHHPVSQTVALGGSATLTVEVSGAPPFHCRWLLNGTILTADAHRVMTDGVSGGSLLLQPVGTNDAGLYSVVVTNIAGAITSAPAMLTVLFPPVITNAPLAKTNALASNVKFTVLATGSEPLAYQWFLNDQPLANDTRIGGATSSSLTVRALEPADAGFYSVRVSNVVGSAAAQTMLCLLAPPWIGDQPIDQTAAMGSSVSFQVSAFSPEPLTYVWQFNGSALGDTECLSGSATPRLDLSNLQPGDAGPYRVIVANRFGSVTSQVARLVCDPGSLLTISRALGEPPRLFLLGEVGHTYRLEASPDLVPPPWPVLTNLTLSNGVQVFTDPQSPTAVPRRFYRAVPQP